MQWRQSHLGVIVNRNRTCLALLAFALLAARAPAAEAVAGPAAAPGTVVVAASGAAPGSSVDGVVEAVRQTVVAAQVAGAVVGLEVRAGDAVRAGQVLVRLDARAAEQASAATDAQVQAARAALDVATQEYERQRKLFDKAYISEAALQRAEAQFKAAQAQASAQLSQAGVARTQSGFFLVRAPYAGVVAEVPVTVGDMALPGRPLLTLYDPSALRVSAAVPQSALAGLTERATVRVELPGLAADAQWPQPGRVQVLPTLDPETHTGTLRVDLPRAPGSPLRPGMFARLWLPQGGDAGRLFIPAAAVLRRTELTAVYVIAADGHAQLRQVRVGPVSGDQVEVLSGLAAGERIAADPRTVLATH